jgi:two-component system phosphate regulon sensor histidine kinase PhoR
MAAPDRRLDLVAGGQLEWRASAALAAQSELGAVPNLAGIWGEASVRMRRWIRQSVQQVQQGDQRLNDILLALQASPNGVVLLDAQGRIEWCNQISAKQFGFDAERDVMQHRQSGARSQFSAYFAAQDFSHDLVMQGRESTPSRPVKLSVQLYGYGEGASCCWRAM